MSKKRGIILAAVLVAGLGGLLWHVLSTVEPEPVYEGKRLSAWLEGYAATTNRNYVEAVRDANNAVRHIGTNAIPTLLRMVQAHDSRLKLRLVALAQKQHLVRFQYTPSDVRHWWADMAFNALGARARDAVPALMRIYEDNTSLESRRAAVSALMNIGPAAKPAVPLLLRVATDTNAADVYAIAVRETAIAALGEIHAEPELLVPVLTRALSDPVNAIQCEAARALGRFGPDADVAVPTLLKLLNDNNSGVRINAAEAIQKIDPEAAAQRKAEIDAAIAPVKLF